MCWARVTTSFRLWLRGLLVVNASTWAARKNEIFLMLLVVCVVEVVVHGTLARARKIIAL